LQEPTQTAKKNCKDKTGTRGHSARSLNKQPHLLTHKLSCRTVFLLHIGCVEQRDTDLYSYDIKSELNDSTTVYPQQYEIEELFTPANTSLQSNKEGLVINPLTPASGYSLFYYQHEDLNACCSLFMIFNS